MLSFTLLGRVVLLKDGVPLTQFRSQKEAALLIYLAHTQQMCSRTMLADLLWEGRPTAQALNNLRTVLSRLQKQIGPVLHITRPSLALASPAEQLVDSVRLMQVLDGVGRIETAVDAATVQTVLDSYHGDFLAEFSLSDAPQFEQWVVVTREQIRQQILAAYHKLGSYALATAQTDYGITVARRWLHIDPLDEQAHMLLIQCLLKADRGGEALAYYQSCAALLQAELNVMPPAAMTQLIQTVQQQRAPRATAVGHNLPPTYNQFFGRSTDQQTIHHHLDQPWCRLVTLTGQGGVGKTRLATTVSRDRLPHYPDGVWFVALEEMDANDEQLAEAIAVEIATTLDLRLTGSASPIEQLLTHLQHKEMLLVLDNFEHLLDGIEIVLALIQRCQQLQLLVTSREPLKVQAEWVVQLAGLDYPTSEQDALPSTAVQLFMARYGQRAQAPLSADDEAAIRTICAMVEGLPLAIELAAALTQPYSPRMVAEHLQADFNLLASSLRDVPERHRGLNVVFEMSWNSLTPVLQQQLVQLTVFRGGFTQTAVSQVTAVAPAQLAELIDKSLLNYNHSNGRYSLHPVIRTYAAAKQPLNQTLLENHARFYLTWLASHTHPLQKSRPQTSVNLLEPDSDNIRLAWQTGLACRLDVLLYQALPSLSSYYQLRGLAREAEAVMRTSWHTAVAWHTPLAIRIGLEWARFQNRLGYFRPAMQTVKTAVGLAARAGDAWANAMGYVWWGESLWRLGEYEAAEEKLLQALQRAHTLDDESIVAWCHHQLGIVNDIQGHYTPAQTHLEQACAIWQQLENAQALSNSFNSIGVVYYHQGDLLRAQQAMEQALTLCKQVDNRHVHASLLNNLSTICTEQADYLGARYYLQLGLELAMANSNLTLQSEIYTNLGKNHLLLGEANEAIAHSERALQMARSVGNRSIMAMAMFNLGAAAADPETAVRWYGQALDIARQDNLKLVAYDLLVAMAKLVGTTDRTQAKQFYEEALLLAQTMQNATLLARTKEVAHLLALSSDTPQKDMFA